MTVKRTIDHTPVPVRIWTEDVTCDAVQQLEHVARLPFVHSHVAAMPDVHVGVGSTIGSVIPTRGAIIPAAVGVDIGCGMIAARLSIDANALPDSLGGVRSEIEARVPVGFHMHDERNVRTNGVERLKKGYDVLTDKVPALAKMMKHRDGWQRQIGTLGGGNHFIEVCLDELDRVWVMLHSGSRGIGNQIGRHFIALAREEMLALDAKLPDKNLAYLREGTESFDLYVEALGWAQDYASENRAQMLELVLDALRATLPPFELTEHAVNCHHNYVAREHHFGAEVYVTRKGAIRAGDRRARDHSRLDGRAVLHRARQGCCGELQLMRPRRRAPDVTLAGEEGVQRGRSRPADGGGRVPEGFGRGRRDSGRLQGHRRGDGQSGRSGRGRAHAQAGRMREGVARDGWRLAPQTG